MPKPPIKVGRQFQREYHRLYKGYIFVRCSCGLTKKAEPPPTRGVNRDSGTDSANGGWLRRLVRPCHRDTHKITRKSWLRKTSQRMSANSPTLELARPCLLSMPASPAKNVPSLDSPTPAGQRATPNLHEEQRQTPRTTSWNLTASTRRRSPPVCAIQSR